MTDHSAFIARHTHPQEVDGVPEIRLYQAHETNELWHLTQAELDHYNLQPPFWAFPWAGGQALARYILDQPSTVQGKRVLDFASGSGLVAIAAMKAGAHLVEAVDIDPFAVCAISMNAQLNAVDLNILADNLVGINKEWDILLAGDVFYDRLMAEKITPWFETLAQKNIDILIGDPGRTYLPDRKMIRCADYHIHVSAALEDCNIKKVTIWKFPPAATS